MCHGSLPACIAPTGTVTGAVQVDIGSADADSRRTTRFGEGTMSTAHITHRSPSNSSDGDNRRSAVWLDTWNSCFGAHVTPSVELVKYSCSSEPVALTS